MTKQKLARVVDSAAGAAAIQMALTGIMLAMRLFMDRNSGRNFRRRERP